MARFTYDYPRPAVTVDLLLLAWQSSAVCLLLVRRARPPFAGRWALPGGFINPEEDLPAAARRECREETGVAPRRLTQLGAFGNPRRDPRGRTISVVFYGLLPPGAAHPTPGDDAAEARWTPLARLPRLAFDHAAIVRAGLAVMRARAQQYAWALELLPPAFTLVQAQRIFEGLLGTALDKRNFRKKLSGLGVLVPAASPGAPAAAGQRYRLDRAARRGLDVSLPGEITG